MEFRYKKCNQDRIIEFKCKSLSDRIIFWILMLGFMLYILENSIRFIIFIKVLITG